MCTSCTNYQVCSLWYYVNEAKPNQNCLSYHHFIYFTFSTVITRFTLDKTTMFRNRYKTNNTERRLGLPTVNFKDMKSTRRGSDTEDTEDDTDYEDEELSIDDAPTKQKEQTQNEQKNKSQV